MSLSSTYISVEFFSSYATHFLDKNVDLVDERALLLSLVQLHDDLVAVRDLTDFGADGLGIVDWLWALQNVPILLTISFNQHLPHRFICLFIEDLQLKARQIHKETLEKVFIK